MRSLSGCGQRRPTPRRSVAATPEPAPGPMPPTTRTRSRSSQTVHRLPVESRRAATTVADLFAVIARTIDEHADELGRIDVVAGDGDHGIGMQRGSTAAAAAAQARTRRAPVPSQPGRPTPGPT